MHAFNLQMCGFIHRRILLGEPQTISLETHARESLLANPEFGSRNSCYGIKEIPLDAWF
jgi:hypothetical protein